MPQLPIILLAFANEAPVKKEHLHHLTDEAEAIQTELRKLKTQYEVITIFKATTDKIYHCFKAHRGQIELFHFAGHANGQQILVNKAVTQDMESLWAEGLMPFLGEQAGLKLVFINGCSSLSQAQDLHKAGISTIGTTASIQDEIAVKIATNFYQSLATGATVVKAWREAEQQIIAENGLANPRDLVFKDAPDQPTRLEELWEFLPQDEHRAWRLTESSTAQQPKKYLTDPPLRPREFLGREGKLADIHRQLFEEDKHSLLLINGEGGIGKTTLAAKYWYEYEEEYTHLIWLLVTNNLADDLIALGTRLDLRYPPKATKNEQLRALLQQLRNYPAPCLLVLDNANQVKALDSGYEALRTCSSLHLLFTSRLAAYEELPVLKIAALSPEAAEALFLTHYPLLHETEKLLLGSILSAIGYNTLVTSLLAKNLAVLNNTLEQPYSLQQLLEDLQQKGLLGIQTGDIKTSYQAAGLQLREHNPIAIISGMYELGNLAEQERQLLSLFAVLPPEAMEYKFLKDMLALKDLDKALLSLKQKGWLDQGNHKTSFKISPVIQEVVRAKNKERLFTDSKALISSLNDKLKSGGTDTLLSNDFEERASFIQKSVFLTTVVVAEEDNLAVLYEQIGMYYTMIGDLDKALAYYQKYEALSEDLSSSYPNQASYQYGLGVSYFELGKTYTSLGHLDKALAYYQKFAALSEDLSSSYPNQASYQNGLAISYCMLGITYTSLKDLDKALNFYQKNQELCESLHKLFPNHTKFQSNLAVSYQYLGNTYIHSGDLNNGLGFYQKYRELCESLHKSHPNHTKYQNNLAISYEKLGKTYMSLGDLDKALNFYQKSRELKEFLYTSFPNIVSYKDILAISYAKLGDFYHHHQKDLIKAKDYYLQCQKLWQELCKRSPNYKKFQDDLAWVNRLLEEFN